MYFFFLVPFPINRSNKTHFNPVINTDKFYSHILHNSYNQVSIFLDKCKTYDSLINGKCILTTNTSETISSAYPLYALFNNRSLQFHPENQIHSIRKLDYFEPGYIADRVINPLISSYVLSGQEKFIKAAEAVGLYLISLYSSILPPPFLSPINLKINRKTVFIDEVSPFIVSLASLYYHTKNKLFTAPIEKFERSVKSYKLSSEYDYNSGKPISNQNPPLSLFSDLYRIAKITSNNRLLSIIRTQFPQIKLEKPLEYYRNNSVIIEDIGMCRGIPFLQQNDPSFQALKQACLNEHGTVVRIRSNSEYGSYPLDPSFSFNSELIEAFWSLGEISLAKKLITSAIFNSMQPNGIITGMTNVTQASPTSDGRMWPEMFSRWFLGGILINSAVSFDEIVLSEGGHILKYQK